MAALVLKQRGNELNKYSQIAVTLGWMIFPFVAMAFYGIGNIVGQTVGRPIINGASLYNWLSVAVTFVVGFAVGPEALGRLLATFSLSWFVGWRLSVRYRKEFVPSFDGIRLK
jgi:hypothetical protein